MAEYKDYVKNLIASKQDLSGRIDAIRDGLNEVKDNTSSQASQIEVLCGAVDELAMIIAGEEE